MLHQLLTSRPSRGLFIFLASVVLLASFSLRVYRLVESDVWWDEGWAVVLARLPLAQSLRQTASDEHPPLYYWMLHFWDQAAGETALAVRLPSVLAATLTVAVLLRVGTRLGGTRLGLLAAMLLALNIFHIHWSQQAKMYALAALFCLASFWLLLQLARPRSKRRILLAYGLSALAAIALHYISGLLIGALGLAGAWWGFERWRNRQPAAGRWMGTWLGLHLALAAVLVPWGVYLIYGAPHPQFTAPTPLPPGLYVQVVATVLTLGQSTEISVYWVSTSLLLLLSIAWLPKLASAAPQQRLASRALLLAICLPTGLIYGLSMVPAAQLYAPKFDSRYLLLLAPLGVLAIAWGLHSWTLWLRRARPRLGAALVVVLIAVVSFLAADRLLPYYRNRQQTADFVTAMHALNNLARAQDGIVVYTDRDWPVFAYYNHTGLGWAGIPSQADLTAAEVAARIDPVTAAHRAVWVVVSPDSIALDPQRRILARLASRYPISADLALGNFRLQLYTNETRVLTQLDGPPRPEIWLDLPVAAAAPTRFIGYDLPVRDVTPGEYFPVGLYWQAPASISATWRLRLADPQGMTVREANGRLAPNLSYVNTALPISAAWISGPYRLTLVVEPDGAASSQTKLSAWTLDTIHIQNQFPAGDVPQSIDNRIHADFGGLIWLDGSSAIPTRSRRGQSLALTLYWRAQHEMNINYTVFVHFLGRDYNPDSNNFLWGQVDHEPLAGGSPTSGWFPGQAISDPYTVPLSPYAPRGTYGIEVGLYDHSTGSRLPVTTADGGISDSVVVGTIEVK